MLDDFVGQQKLRFVEKDCGTTTKDISRAPQNDLGLDYILEHFRWAGEAPRRASREVSPHSWLVWSRRGWRLDYRPRVSLPKR